MSIANTLKERAVVLMYPRKEVWGLCRGDLHFIPFYLEQNMLSGSGKKIVPSAFGLNHFLSVGGANEQLLKCRCVTKQAVQTHQMLHCSTIKGHSQQPKYFNRVFD